MSYSFSEEIKKGDIKELSKIFAKYFLFSSNIIESLISLSKKGDLLKELRPMTWKIYLGILPNNEDLKEWVEKTNTQRIKYKKKLKKYLSIKKYKGDPLGGGSISNNNKKNEKDYNTLYKENELRRIINLDIVRTYQNVDLFSQEKIKKLLLNILFIWCKENEDVSYRQGMNELLAILILCFYPYYFNFEDNQKPTKDDIIKYLNINDENEKKKYFIKIYNFFHDEEEIESDLFFAFDSLMKKGMKNLFDPKLIHKNEPDYKLYELFPDVFNDDIEEDKPNFISRRCFLLINEKLKIIDEELFKYLKKIDINCGAFLQKWLRCIFCREFKLDQVFILWDIILLQDFINENNKYSLMFMDSVCLSMIIKIRNKLLKSDQNDCFTLFFKYPHLDNIKDIIILSYNIYEILNEKIKGKRINPELVLNIVKSIKDDEDDYEIKENNFKTPFANKSSEKLFYDKSNLNEKENFNTKQDFNKNNFVENKNRNIYSNEIISEYEAKSFINDAISSLGKIGNKLKDQLKVAKDTVLGLDIYEDENNIRANKESKMSDLFDIPNFNNGKQINKNKVNENFGEEKKDFSNIIKRLQRIDNKYNKFFDEEDKKEIENIINELLK